MYCPSWSIHARSISPPLSIQCKTKSDANYCPDLREIRIASLDPIEGKLLINRKLKGVLHGRSRIVVRCSHARPSLSSAASYDFRRKLILFMYSSPMGPKVIPYSRHHVPNVSRHLSPHTWDPHANALGQPHGRPQGNLKYKSELHPLWCLFHRHLIKLSRIEKRSNNILLG